MNTILQTKNQSFFSYQNRSKARQNSLSNSSSYQKQQSAPLSSGASNTKNEKLAQKIQGLNKQATKQYVNYGHKTAEDGSEEKSYISDDFKNYTYTATTEVKESGGYVTQTTSSSNSSSSDTAKKKLNYNYKDVSNMIQRAKTSAVAGQAVMKAKRKVLELKRKLASGDGDTEEIQTALNHAKSMERTARKKKRHLEMEELIAANQKRDEEYEKDGGDATRSAIEDLRGQAEEKLSDAEGELDREATEQLEESAEAMRGGAVSDTEFAAVSDAPSDAELMQAMAAYAMQGGAFSDGALGGLLDMTELSDEMFAEMDAMMDEFADAEQEMLEETMDQLELSDAFDPNMSKADLEDLKRKHRNAERKEIVKAEMEYLKATFDQLSKKSGADFAGLSGGASGIGGAAGGFATSAMPSFSASIPAVSGAELAMGAFDAAG